MTSIAVISNPLSGRNRGGLERIRAMAARAGVPHFETQSLNDLEVVLRDLARRGVEVLAVNGGDGTVRAVLTMIRDSRGFPSEPTIAVLRGGTTNMIAGDVGLVGRPDQALKRLVEACRNGVPENMVRERRMLALRKAPDRPPIYGFFFGAAAIPRAIRQSREVFHRRGMTGALGSGLSLGWALMRLLARCAENDPILHPDTICYEVDGQERQEVRAILFLVTGLHRLLLGIRPVDPGDALGMAMLTHPYRSILLSLPDFLSVHAGSATRLHDGYRRSRVRCLKLLTGSGYTLDGELFESDPNVPLTLSASAKVRFLCVQT